MMTDTIDPAKLADDAERYADGWNWCLAYETMRKAFAALRSKPTEPQVSAELVERMVAHVRNMAMTADSNDYDTDGLFDEAIDILAELDRKPVDPDLELAREVAGEFGGGSYSQMSLESIVHAAIKRARKTSGDA